MKPTVTFRQTVYVLPQIRLAFSVTTKPRQLLLNQIKISLFQQNTVCTMYITRINRNNTCSISGDLRQHNFLSSVSARLLNLNNKNDLVKNYQLDKNVKSNCG